MPKRGIPHPTVKLTAAAAMDGGGAMHAPAAQRDKRLTASSHSPSWARYTESRLRQFVTRQ